ncbi:FIG00554137: hypothetical protein [Cronobacter muytjensii 530]
MPFAWRPLQADNPSGHNHMQEAMMIALKRVYDEPDAQDGYRVLVDRLWPRNGH